MGAEIFLSRNTLEILRADKSALLVVCLNNKHFCFQILNEILDITFKHFSHLLIFGNSDFDSKNIDLFNPV